MARLAAEGLRQALAELGTRRADDARRAIDSGQVFEPLSATMLTFAGNERFEAAAALGIAVARWRAPSNVGIASTRSAPRVGSSGRGEATG